MYHNSTIIGIMDEAYFVPRQEIIKWINQNLSLNIQAIEDLGTGAVYCQLLDLGFSQRTPMQRVNWKAKFDYQFIANFKIFQNNLEKLGITKKIEIEKLAKAKYQDNLELIQWLKRYIQLNGNIALNYQAEQRRGYAQLYLISQEKKVLGKSFKINASFSNPQPNGIFNQSFCSKQQKKNIKPSTRNKQNMYFQNKKESLVSSRLNQSMNEIKKVLISNYDRDTKLSEIHKIAYGSEAKLFTKYDIENTNLNEIDGQQSDEQLVF